MADGRALGSLGSLDGLVVRYNEGSEEVFLVG
jgi:hypothetical protein